MPAKSARPTTHTITPPPQVPTTPLASAAKPRKSAKVLAGSTAPPVDASRKKMLADYESALKLLQTRKYDQAHAAFNAMLADAPHDFADRIRMYIAACITKIDKGTTDFRSHEERYDYAISLLNHGHYEDAREHFQEILLNNQSADYVFYGMAILASMTGNPSKCIEHLTEAIRLNTQNRLLARNDSDFHQVAEDPRFTDLLYPEA